LKKVDDFLVKKGLEKVVTMKAPVKREDLPGVLQSASAVVVPSFSEGFGFAAAEAAACRVPLVISDAGSLPEIVSGRHIFFKSGSRASLLKALHRALRNKWSYKKPIAFTWKKAAESFSQLYRRLIK
ncbi:MAG: glycosyltransferase, partial [Patescibacteria group bacterium]